MVGYTAFMAVEATFRPPSRRQGHKSLEMLLLAAENQLRQQELDFFTVDNVLERAGVSIGSFYARFPGGRDALLHAVQDRLHARLQPGILAALAAQERVDESLDEAVGHVFGILIEHMLRERELIRAFMMFSAFDTVLRHKGHLVYIERREAVTRVLLVHRAEIAHPDPVAAIYLAFAVFHSLINGRFVFFAQHSEISLGVSNEEIFQQIGLWISNYLHGNRSNESDLVRQALAAALPK